MSLPLQLPPPLAPWTPFLELLPLESALALGPLLRRLDGWIGPLRAAPQSGIMEPDGFDGLARRGAPERLLLSEWLLLEEAPLEFLRRLSQSESGYLQLARHDPHTARASLALFDGGPDVLGGPRLVQLAALLVLARRAESAGATFRWGLWQKPGEWNDEVNRESVERWLSLRSEGEPAMHHLTLWKETWKQAHVDWQRDELWLVGSPELAPFVPARARLLQVRDELEPLAPNRAVEVVSEARMLRLELPDDRTGARLLREPFARTAPKTNDRNSFDVEPLDRGLAWAQSGWKLFARTHSGDILSFAVPNSPSATVGPPKMLRPTKKGVVAVGRIGRATVAVSLFQTPSDQSGLFFQWWKRGSKTNEGALFNIPLSENELSATQAAPLGQIFGINNGEKLAVLLSTGRFAMSMDGSGFLRDEETTILAATLSNDQVRLLKPTGESAAFSVQPPHATDSKNKYPPVPSIVHRAFAGWGSHMSASLWAMEGDQGIWHLLTLDHQSDVRVSSSRSVVGCLVDNEPGLLSNTRGERELWFQTATEERKLFRFSSPIESVAVCPFAPLIAVQSQYELGVWSLPQGTWFLRART
ncbi:hypothetical protein IAD21_04385 [Abditibacteriota bacterium]|nr:hypothetical protein IAD21_04385 [Abditibacteriota bacterium]